MQIALGIGILAAIFIGLVLVHFGIVNVLRQAALYLLRGAQWCEEQRVAASASLNQRLEASLEPTRPPQTALQKSAAGPSDPVDALRIMVQVIETLPSEVVQKALALERGVKEPVAHVNGVSRNGRSLA